jgi:hypothetical protein
MNQLVVRNVEGKSPRTPKSKTHGKIKVEKRIPGEKTGDIIMTICKLLKS